MRQQLDTTKPETAPFARSERHGLVLNGVKRGPSRGARTMAGALAQGPETGGRFGRRQLGRGRRGTTCAAMNADRRGGGNAMTPLLAIV